MPYSFASLRTIRKGRPEESEAAAASATAPSSGPASRDGLGLVLAHRLGDQLAERAEQLGHGLEAVLVEVVARAAPRAEDEVALEVGVLARARRRARPGPLARGPPRAARAREAEQALGLGRALRERDDRAVVEVELDPVAAARRRGGGSRTAPGGGADRRAGTGQRSYALASSFFRVVVARFAGARLGFGLGFGFGSAEAAQGSSSGRRRRARRSAPAPVVAAISAVAVADDEDAAAGERRRRAARAPCSRPAPRPARSSSSAPGECGRRARRRRSRPARCPRGRARPRPRSGSRSRSGRQALGGLRHRGLTLTDPYSG